jgi:predicted AlkP superfamily phosphohydrolase/phosphomutase
MGSPNTFAIPSLTINDKVETWTFQSSYCIYKVINAGQGLNDVFAKKVICLEEFFFMIKNNTTRREFIKYVTYAGGSLIFSGFANGCTSEEPNSTGNGTRHPKKHLRPKLYWFIPDGLRCDPSTFQIYKWAEAGQLPNIKKMMDNGAYGYSIPVFPGHTPTNFATLFTGATPKIHGVADGPMRTEGYPLKMVSKGGFSSIAKKVPPIWYTLEKQNIISTLLSLPGSTPPELNRGVTIRGRWGGWGLEFPTINFHCEIDQELRIHQGLGNRVFYYGSELTKYINTREPNEWKMDLPASHHLAREIEIRNWGETFYGYIYASRNGDTPYYDNVLFSKDKQTVLAHLKEGQWSDWLPVKLSWETKNDYNIYTPKRMSWERGLSTISIDTEVKIKVIKLGHKDFFRIRLCYNSLNKHLVRPSYLAEEISEKVGPMVDFVDSYPPQLIYYNEDKTTFLEEQWHRNIVSYMINHLESDVIIQSIYTPNQMLTSRWWLGHIDPDSPRYANVGQAERKKLWVEVKHMYQQIDAIIGEIISHCDQNCYIILSSDHGAVPLYKEVRLNNLFAKTGLLKYRISNQTGEYEIDWENSQVIFLKMFNIYINPKGLAGNYNRATGPEYNKLRIHVKQILMSLTDEKGINPVAKIVNWEDAELLDLPKDRVGDLIIANKANYGWIEEISSDLRVFKDPLKSGYKQAVLPDNEMAMWTPFMIMGPGIKTNYEIPQPIRHIDQYPTIMKLLGKNIPSFVEGKPLNDIFEPA